MSDQVPDAPNDERRKLDRSWSRYLLLHTLIVAGWPLLIVLEGETLPPWLNAVALPVLVVVASTYPLAFFLPLATLRLLWLARRWPWPFLILALLDTTLCVLHFTYMLVACSG